MSRIRIPSMALPAIASALLACITSSAFSATNAAITETVGRYDSGRLVTPVNQTVTSAGQVLDLPGMRPQVLALSPDGRLLAVSGKTNEVVIVDPDTGAIRQRVALPNEAQAEPSPEAASSNYLQPDKKGQVSFTGLAFTPDGRRLFLSNVNGSLKVFSVAPDGTVSPSHSIPLPLANAPRRKEEIPTGLAFSSDGSRLYVCANLSNQLLEIDASSGKVLRSFPVGVAPYDVVLADGKAFVSNWGGRRPSPNDFTGPAGRGTVVRVDPVRKIASEGSVSVITLAEGSTEHSEILTGRHACALALSPNRRFLVCANAGADTLSVIDLKSLSVVETVWTKPSPSDLFGASPNALAFAPSGKRLFVANGTQNAVAVVDFDPSDRESKFIGTIPAGWFPGAIVFDPHRTALAVANIKSLPLEKQQAKHFGKNGVGFNSRQFTGSLSLIKIPADRDLPALSRIVDKNLRRDAIKRALLPPRSNQPARAIPERIREPSPIKHVVYIIKENRTYDQVLGDIPEGNGDPSLCIFGENVTPNQHKIVRDFVLLDNTYCNSILSADGHQWSTTAFATDYMEKSFAGFPRSYPDGMGDDEVDALAYSPAGFIWDNAMQRGLTLRNYGEFMKPTVKWSDGRSGTPSWLSCFQTWKGLSSEVTFACEPMIDTIAHFSPRDYVGWAMFVPDQYRADFIIRELKDFVAKGSFPNLTIICLPNDHNSGTKKGFPTPNAATADNDLAFARIVEALSHSPFWKEMAIFAIEDDPQAGWDHVSGYRTTAYVVSPYAKRKAVVNTQYNTTSILRTIEQILGMPVMNQFDASATPLFDCFTDTPDFTPFKALPSNIPLDELNPDPVAIADPVLRADALASERMNFAEVDKAPEDQLNRILWRYAKGPRTPFPDWAVTRIADNDD